MLMSLEDRTADFEENVPENRKAWHAPRLELIGQPAAGGLADPIIEDGTYTATS